MYVAENSKLKSHLHPAPVEVGDELEVNIIDRMSSGDGFSNIQGYTIIVPRAKPGERVNVRITAIEKKTATAEII